MKTRKITLIIVAIVCVLMTSACTGPSESKEISLNSQKTEDQKRPKLPSEVIETKKPKIPLKASVLDATAQKPSLPKPALPNETEMILAEIDSQIEPENITAEDIRRGWYFGYKKEKKYGTPELWVWIDDGENSRWISPAVMEEEARKEDKKLCASTSGVYAFSCLDTESENCVYVAETSCQCPEKTKWVDGSGCIMTDKEGDYVAITPEEFTRGWYRGLPHQKKLNTPSSWIWADVEGGARWKNPGAL